MDNEKELFFSVIIPAYNVEKYLSCCVESVLCQNFPRYEIIIIDDGSIDQTPAICDSLMRKHEQIKVIHKENGGLSSARNSGIEIANGEYLIFLDGDDELSECALSDLNVEIVKNGSPDVCIGQFEVIGENCASFAVKDFPIESKCIDSFNREGILTYLLTHRYLHSACKLIIRNDFLKKEKLWFKNGLYHEDELWTSATFVKVTSICLYNKPFYKYKLHQNSIMTTRNIKKITDRLEVAKELLKLAGSFYEECIEKKYLMDRVKSLVLSAFSEVLLYQKHEVYCVIDRIDELIKMDAEVTSKMRIHPMIRVFGFRKTFKIYYFYYIIKRKLITHRSLV